METKIRKQIYLGRQQNEIVKQASQRLGVSEAEVIRQAIVAQSRRFRGAQHDLTAWERERSFIQSLIEQGEAAGQRSWRREDLYER